MMWGEYFRCTWIVDEWLNATEADIEALSLAYGDGAPLDGAACAHGEIVDATTFAHLPRRVYVCVTCGEDVDVDGDGA